MFPFPNKGNSLASANSYRVYTVAWFHMHEKKWHIVLLNNDLKVVSHHTFESWSMWSAKMFLIDWFIRPILQITLQVDKTKKLSVISWFLKKTNILVDMKCSAFFLKRVHSNEFNYFIVQYIIDKFAYVAFIPIDVNYFWDELNKLAYTL